MYDEPSVKGTPWARYYPHGMMSGGNKELYDPTVFWIFNSACCLAMLDHVGFTDLKIISTSQQGNYITITSAIVQNGGGREQVKWRLIPAGGGYKISDINIKGVWLTIATKKRFSDVLNKSKGDFNALFAELREAETW
jgi:hypothetical protein